MICLTPSLKNLTLIVCILGGVSGYAISNVNLYFYNKSLNFYLFSFMNISIWFIPILSTIGVIKYPLSLGFSTMKSFDQG